MRLFFLVVALVGCTSPGVPADARATDGGAPPADAEGELDAASPAARATVPLPGCTGLDGVDEACTLVLDASGCTDAPCRRLVVVFSGGEQGCVRIAQYATVLSAYAGHGWAAACVNYFETADGSDAVPYHLEADRIDLALREVTTGAWAETYWTGEDLLLEGISHGATAPPIAMARTSLDDGAHWHGTRSTGACFFDGSYDQAATAANLADSGALGGPCMFPVSHQRWIDRYCGGTPCDLAADEDAQLDTISAVDPAEYAIADFQILECGSGLDPCREDILPAPPIEALCAALEAGPTTRCDYVSLPDQSHVDCHGASFDLCRTWFEARFP